MDNTKCYPVYRAELRLKIRSEEINESLGLPGFYRPFYDLSYFKRAELPCSPTVGMEIAGLWSAMKITKIVVFEEHANCFLEEFVGSKKALDESLGELEQYLSDGGWTEEPDGQRPQP